MRSCPYCAESIQDAAIVCKHCRRDIAPAASTESGASRANLHASRAATAPSKTANTRRSLVLLGALLTAGLLGMMAFETNGGSVGGVDTSASPIRPHRVISIANESALDIEAGHYVSWQWDGGGYRTCNVKGRVLGLAGGNKDVDVMLVNEDGFINLKSGNSFKVYYESGRQAASSFDFNVDGSGKYVLVVSNAHSLFTPKTVQVQDVRATCVG